MGIVSRYIERRVARAMATADTEKALNPSLVAGLGAAPAGVVTDARPLVEALARNQNPTQPRGENELPWMEPYTGFGPGVPVAPAPFDPRLPATGRALPRRSEFPVSWNIPGQGQPLVPFAALRKFADAVDVVRLCIGVRKKELSSVEWQIGLSDSLVSQYAAEQNITSARARTVAAKEYAPDIQRITEFFEKPDRINRLSFTEWMFQLLEEVFVLDALSVYPHPDNTGRLHSLEILDGATIKPLLDHRGAFPQPPQPAYQQILWAFPRGEFHFSDEDEARGAGALSTDELIYRPRERRSFTPYGFSPTEQALISGDLYLKRQEWLRSEYTDGSVPQALMIPKDGSSTANWTPSEVRQYETLLNSQLSGMTKERMRWRLTPPGVDVNFPPDFAQKFTGAMDDYLIKLLCAFFDVMPSEIGFTPPHGLGGAGHQQGEANSVTRIGNKPMLAWITDILNDIMRSYLGAPSELTFQFQLEEAEDEKVKADIDSSDIKVGIRTLNDTRGDRGLPLLSIPEADEPFIITPNGPVFLSGLLEQHTASVSASVAGSQQAEGIATGKIEDPKVTAAREAATVAPPGNADPKAPPEAKAEEVKKFARYVSKRAGKSWRDFEFLTLAANDAERFNELGAAGDVDAIKAAVADLGKARARRGPGSKDHRKLVEKYAGLIGQALEAAFPHLDHVVRSVLAGRGPSHEVTKAAVAWDDSGVQQMLRSEVDDDQLAAVFDTLYRDSFQAGTDAAVAQMSEWDGWEAGDDAAASAAADLQSLLDDAGIQIKSVLDTKMAELSSTLRDALASGQSVDATASQLRSLLTDPSRAEMISTTETARAMTSATLSGYQSGGVTEIEWLLSDGACPECEENESASPIAIGDEWPNGDPPVHPWCVCSLAPHSIDLSSGTDDTPTEETE